MTRCRNNSARLCSFLFLILVLWATQDLYAKKKPPLHPVNLNTASSAELQQVPGIGPATAEKILQTRKSYGRFKSVNDLQAIRGIGPKKLERMRKYLTVGAPAQTAKSTGSSLSHPKTAAAPKPIAKPPTAPKAPPPAASEDEEP